MLFHSQVFLLAYLPLTLGLYYLLGEHHRVRIWVLIIASLGFYGYWDLRFLPLLVGSVSVNWLLAMAYQRGRFGGLVFIGVGFNLILIGLFKYADFLVDTLAEPFGWSHDPWNIILPLGISFFTFQQISYLVALNRGKAPNYGFADYAL